MDEVRSELNLKKWLGSTRSIKLEGIMYMHNRNTKTTVESHLQEQLGHKWGKTRQGQIAEWTSNASKKYGKVWVNLGGPGWTRLETCRVGLLTQCVVLQTNPDTVHTPRVFWVLISWGSIWKDSYAFSVLQTVLSSIQVSMDEQRLWGLQSWLLLVKRLSSTQPIIPQNFMPEIPTALLLY